MTFHYYHFSCFIGCRLLPVIVTLLIMYQVLIKCPCNTCMFLFIGFDDCAVSITLSFCMSYVAPLGSFYACLLYMPCFFAINFDRFPIHLEQQSSYSSIVAGIGSPVPIGINLICSEARLICRLMSLLLSKHFDGKLKKL